jgi:hypothetical protein
MIYRLVIATTFCLIARSSYAQSDSTSYRLINSIEVGLGAQINSEEEVQGRPNDPAFSVGIVLNHSWTKFLISNVFLYGGLSGRSNIIPNESNLIFGGNFGYNFGGDQSLQLWLTAGPAAIWTVRRGDLLSESKEDPYSLTYTRDSKLNPALHLEGQLVLGGNKDTGFALIYHIDINTTSNVRGILFSLLLSL